MPRWLRWIGRAVAGLVLLVVLAAAALYAVTTRHIGRTYDFPDSPVRAATDSAALARGRHLVEAIGKCQECHDADMGGKLWVDEPAFGRLAGANLTGGRAGSATSPTRTSSGRSAAAWGGTGGPSSSCRRRPSPR